MKQEWRSWNFKIRKKICEVLAKARSLAPSSRSLAAIFGPASIISALSSVVEHILHTDGVAGSNPAARTIFPLLDHLSHFMKSYISATFATASIFLTTQASAIEPAQLEGNWRGTRIEKDGGKTFKVPVRINFKTAPDGGILISESGSFRSVSFFSQSNLANNGNYRSTLTVEGERFGTATGKWRNSPNVIKISGVAKVDGESDRFKGTIKLISPNKVVFSNEDGSVKTTVTR